MSVAQGILPLVALATTNFQFLHPLEWNYPLCCNMFFCHGRWSGSATPSHKQEPSLRPPLSCVLGRLESTHVLYSRCNPIH